MIRRQSVPSVLTSPQQFLASLRTSPLFSRQQREALDAALVDSVNDAPSVLQTLIDRQLLTPYQAERFASGFGDGLVLGPYRILDRLGSGGMGQVFKAEHIIMKRLVALKVIASRPWGQASPGDSDDSLPEDPAALPWRVSVPCEAGDAGAVGRFCHEVQIAAQLDHPNIVRAYDAAEARGLFFLVMEHVEGSDLRARVAEGGPLALSVACDYVRQAALGLQYAHERGLVHRDIKPSNLLVTPDGVVKILDLGLARLAGAVSQELVDGSGSDNASLAGTPDYMAPETAQDSCCADVRSDLYSLGCTFYFLLTGQAPYPGGGWPEKLLRHQLDSTPSVVVIRPDVPDGIAAILQRLMAKDPAQRYQTPRELAADLDGWLLADRSGSDSRGMLASTILGSSAPTIMMADAVSRAEAGLPLNPNTPNGASVAPTPPAPIAVRRKSFPWPLGLVAAVIIGLASALLLPPPTGTRSDRDRGRGLRLTGANVPEEPSVFEVEGVTDRLPNLAAAVAAAPHGGTITIHGNGPFSVRTIQARGKALTIKAATAVRPRLRFAPPANSQPWEALLATDQPLRLDGLELVHETRAAGSEPSPAHLVYVDKASLHLTDCIIHAPQGTACVVCRACRDVRMEGCRFVAAALALCVETGNAHTDVMLHNSRLSVQTPRSAALSFWAAETGGNGALRLRLEGCAIEAGRPIAFGALPHGVAVSALHNHFSFHEALVSFANARGPAELRHAATWQEDGNVYDSHGVAWLHMNGGPAGIRDLSEWRKLWDGGRASTERETAAAAPASPARAE